MRRPLTTDDFLSRAGTVFRRRIGVVDDPSELGDSPGELSIGDIVQLSRVQASARDAMGISRWDEATRKRHSRETATVIFMRRLRTPFHGWSKIAVC
jgi:hypothetical protein